MEQLRLQMKSQYEEEQAAVSNDPAAIAAAFREAHPQIVKRYATQSAWCVHVLMSSPVPSDDVSTALSMASAYGKDAQVHELTKCFMELGIPAEDVIWHSITVKNVPQVIGRIAQMRKEMETTGRNSSNPHHSGALDSSDSSSDEDSDSDAETKELERARPLQPKTTMVLNLCDGTEDDGYPGMSVLRELEAHNFMYTGSGPAFYEYSTSKLIIKKRLIDANVSTSPYAILRGDYSDDQTAAALAGMGCRYPLVLKPSVSYASAGITVVWNTKQATQEAARLRSEFGDVYAEMFIQGREFTVLVTGDDRSGVKVFDGAERCFNKNLPWHKQLLTFDLYWAVGKSAADAPHYWYQRAPDEDQPALHKIARDAYVAMDGSGYGRVDIRQDARTGVFYVLEVNAQCGFSDGVDSSMGNILMNVGFSLAELVELCLEYGIKRGHGEEEHPLDHQASPAAQDRALSAEGGAHAQE
jgi:D-alanine-D-alanine ligase-like ATP-grasp enzyme